MNEIVAKLLPDYMLAILARSQAVHLAMLFQGEESVGVKFHCLRLVVDRYNANKTRIGVFDLVYFVVVIYFDKPLKVEAPLKVDQLTINQLVNVKVNGLASTRIGFWTHDLEVLIRPDGPVTIFVKYPNNWKLKDVVPLKELRDGNAFHRKISDSPSASGGKVYLLLKSEKICKRLFICRNDPAGNNCSVIR